MSVLLVAALEVEIAAVRRRHPDADVLVTGPGKVLAAGELAARLAEARPDAVLVLGTAGALQPGLDGTHEVAAVAQHDFDDAAIAALVGRRYGAEIRLAGDGPRLATGDVFVADAGHVARLAGDGFALVDMEGYAYAAVCRAAGVPLRIVKAVSDGANDGAVASWADNVHRCAELLADWYDGDLRAADPVVR